jgi:hypothetical protein
VNARLFQNNDLIDNSPAIYGWVKCNRILKVPSGTKEIYGRAHIPFVPDGLVTFPNREPSHKWLGYFQNPMSPTCTLFGMPPRAMTAQFSNSNDMVQDDL